MRGRRDRFVVATKIGWKCFDSLRRVTAYDTVEKLIAGVEASLDRLETDYVDIIQSHINFRDPTMEIFLEGFQRLQRDGKVRAYGVSTGSLEYLRQFNSDGGCACVQVEYSILNRRSELDILPYCQMEGLGVIVRGPLAMGILTGKFHADSRFAESDVRRRWQDDPDQRAMFLEALAKVDRLAPLAQERTLAQLALQFVLAHPAVTSVVAGARTTQQLGDNLATAHLPALTPVESAYIDAITLPGSGRAVRS
jgi:aryl-alcohol dehydrogenase-like predicted oxidoreductase